MSYRTYMRIQLDAAAAPRLSSPPVVMNCSLHRYYYYYGPRSHGSDGQAMGCRRALTM